MLYFHKYELYLTNYCFLIHFTLNNFIYFITPWWFLIEYDIRRKTEKYRVEFLTNVCLSYPLIYNMFSSPSRRTGAPPGYGRAALGFGSGAGVPAPLPAPALCATPGPASASLPSHARSHRPRTPLPHETLRRYSINII